MVKIELLGLEFFAYHGVHPNELQKGNNFIVDISLTGDYDQAVRTDDLNDTIDYESVYNLVAKEMQVKSKLLEHIAGRILERIVNSYPEINQAIVTVEKLKPPIGGNSRATRVTLAKNASLP